MSGARILWRRLDTAGHDACRLVALPSGWRLEGAAAYRHEDGTLCCVSYRAECDRSWRTRLASVSGWCGDQSVDIGIERSDDGAWLLDGAEVGAVRDCEDVDLGFTPATNLFQLRRMALEVGQAEDIAVAWLDIPDGGLSLLRQRYERLDQHTYGYRAPRFDYEAQLRVDANGFVLNYPRLWEAESPAR